MFVHLPSHAIKEQFQWTYQLTDTRHFLYLYNGDEKVVLSKHHRLMNLSSDVNEMPLTAAAPWASSVSF